jgi:hypothetical protein
MLTASRIPKRTAETMKLPVCDSLRSLKPSEVVSAALSFDSAREMMCAASGGGGYCTNKQGRATLREAVAKHDTSIDRPTAAIFRQITCVGVENHQTKRAHEIYLRDDKEADGVECLRNSARHGALAS